MQKLTEQQVQARIEAYEQAIGSLTIGTWTDDPEEVKQAESVIRVLQRSRAAFMRREGYEFANR